MTGLVYTNNTEKPITVTVSDGNERCDECGGSREHQDSNCCIECVARMLGNNEGFEQ
jgi:hypothetical protein